MAMNTREVGIRDTKLYYGVVVWTHGGDQEKRGERMEIHGEVGGGGWVERDTKVVFR